MEKQNQKYVVFLILLLSLITSQIISDRTIQPKVQYRINIQDSIIAGTYEAPYQFRVMKIILGKSVEFFVSKVVRDPIKSHVISYHISMFIVFFGIYTLMYFYLKLFFSYNVILIGLLLIPILIPLGISSYWEEGDYITLLFFLIGFNLMFRSRENLLPLVILIGVINRDQIVFITVFLVAFLWDNKKLFTVKSFILLFLCIAAFLISYFGIRYIMGFKQNFYTTDIQTTTNIGHWKSILGLWCEQVLVYVILSIIAFKRSSLFFKLSFISLILYVVVFFFNSILSQIAKILPAYLILIPMSLSALTGEKMKYFEKKELQE